MTELTALKILKIGIDGVIYFIDEIHLEFNSLESKNVPIEIMVEISQQRKQRKHIVRNFSSLYAYGKATT